MKIIFIYYYNIIPMFCYYYYHCITVFYSSMYISLYPSPPYKWLSSSGAYLSHLSSLIMRLSYRPHKILGFLDIPYYCSIVFFSSIFTSLFMTDRSQIAPLLYYMYITTISELHVQFESSTRFIEIHSILIMLFNND